MNELNLYIMSHERDELPWISCWGTPRTWQYELSYEAIQGWSLPCRGPIPPKKKITKRFISLKPFAVTEGGVNDGRISLSIMKERIHWLKLIDNCRHRHYSHDYKIIIALQLIARKLGTPNIKQKSIVQDTRSHSNKVLFTIQANRVGPDENNASD